MSTGLLTIAPPSTAVDSSAKCARLVVIGLRGTDETEYPNYGMTRNLVRLVKYRFTRTVRSQSLTPSQYPARGGTSYKGSVEKGVGSLRSIVRNLVSSCSSTEIVLIGYSQGAHVIGDMLDNRGEQLSSTVNKRIKAVVFYGDPTFKAGESYNRPAHTRSGYFPRPKGDLSKYASRIRSYCNSNDAWCQAMFPLGQGEHRDYQKHNESAYSFIKSRF